MSSEGFKNIPGVPDGWELVHANRIAEAGEYVLDGNGVPMLFNRRSVLLFPIIRKIETHKKYRQFANKAEYEPHRNRWWRWKDPIEPCDTTFPPIGYGENGLLTATWEQAFQGRVFDDGTPFGVEVQVSKDESTYEHFLEVATGLSHVGDFMTSLGRSIQRDEIEIERLRAEVAELESQVEGLRDELEAARKGDR
jgi:hypothetical protein